MPTERKGSATAGDPLRLDRPARVAVKSEVEGMITPEARILLSLGRPMFIPARKIGEGVLTEADAGVECMAFGRRWRDVARKNCKEDEQAAGCRKSFIQMDPMLRKQCNSHH